MALSPEDKAEVRRLARLEADAVFNGPRRLHPATGRYDVLNQHPNDFGVARNTAFDALDAAEGGDPFAV